MADTRTAEAEVFDVVLLGFGPGAHRAVDDLKHTFGIDQRAAERLVRSLPAKVKRGVPRVRAEYFRRALQRIGAAVEVRDAVGNVIASLPASAPPPAAPPPSVPNVRDAAPEGGPADTFVEPAPGPQPQFGARTLVAAPAPSPAAPASLSAAPGPLHGLGGSGRDTLREAVPAPQVGTSAAPPPATDDAGVRSPSLPTSGPRPSAPSAPVSVPAWATVGTAAPAVWAPNDPEQFATGPTDPPASPLLAEPRRDAPAVVAGHPARHVRPKFDISESIGPRPAPAHDQPMPSLRSAGLLSDPIAEPPPHRPRRPPRARPLRSAPAAGPAAPMPEPAIAPESFFDQVGGAFALPFTGQGPYWIAAIAVWSVAVGVLGMLAQFVPLLGAIVSFFAYTSVLAFACDFARVCFWVAPSGETELDVAPSLDPVRVLNVYIKSGLHLMAFVLISNIVLAIWIVVQLLDGVGTELVTDPFTWAIALGPSLYWPIAVALSAAGNNFGAIWNVPAGLRAIARAPLEYVVIAGTGAATLGLSSLVLVLFGGLFGAAVPFLSPVAGLPLALSHGLMGSLFGHLARARPEVFED